MSASRSAHLDPVTLKFELKSAQLRKIQFLLLFVTYCLGSYRYNKVHPDDLKNKVVTICLHGAVILVIFFLLRRPINSIPVLNWRVFLIEKACYASFLYFSTSQQLQKEGYQENETQIIFMGFQLLMGQCFMMEWQYVALNFMSSWIIYSALQLYIVGNNYILEIGLTLGGTIMYQAISQHFQAKTESHLKQLYHELLEQQSILQYVFKHLPEGVLIKKRHKGGYSNDQCNQSTLKILLDVAPDPGSASPWFKFPSKQAKKKKFRLQQQQRHQSSNQQLIQFLDEHFDRELMVKAHVVHSPSSENGGSAHNVFESVYEFGGHTKKKVEMSLEQLLGSVERDSERYCKIVSSGKRVQVQKLWVRNGEKQIIFLRDVTDVVKQEKSRTSEQMQSILLSSISHDLKSPITSIMASNQNLRERYKSEIDQKVLKMQDHSCQYMLSLIDDITDLTKFQVDKFSLSPSVFSLAELIQETTSLFELRLQEKKLFLKQIIDQQLPKNLFLDRKRLKQILMNLLSNAIKFTVRGGITLKALLYQAGLQEAHHEMLLSEQSPELSFHEEESKSSSRLGHDSYLKIQVEDTGMGISEQDQKRLFKLFGMVKQKNKDVNPNGTGLGLTICKRIARAMGGSIKVNSSEDVGSTFTVWVKLDLQSSTDFEERKLEDKRTDSMLTTLPDIESSFSLPEIASFDQNLKMIIDIEGMQRQEEEEKKDSECTKCARCLVIDDENMNILALELLLSSFGERPPDRANTGLQGIEVMKQRLHSCCCRRPYQFVFVDLNMPVLNGDKMMEQVKQQIQSGLDGMAAYKDTEFILCSALPEGTLASIRQLGFSQILEKPINQQSLKRIIQA